LRNLLALTVLGSATAGLVWFASQPQGAFAQESESACYAIADIEITDREEYRKYEAGFSEVFSKYGGTILAGSEDPEILEGEWPYTRAVLIRFPSREALSAWYDSPEYQKIAQHRFAASRANIIVLSGRR
jgi:uncharacterized protein (DUF1330 family)